jgi:hypothetical protein
MKRSFQLVWLSLLLCALGVAPAQAQTKRKPVATKPAAATPATPTYRYAHEFGYRAGYEDGYVRGKSDFNDARDRDVEASEAYRRADRTYEPKMGNIYEFQHGYRIGFELAYDDGYFGRAYNLAVPPNLARTWQVVNQPAVAAAPVAAATPVPAPAPVEVNRPRTDEPAPRPARTEPLPQSAPPTETRDNRREAIVVRDGIQMKIRLQTPISTKANREGDQFTAIVLDPSEYADAVVTGHIARLKSSGKMTGKTELVLAFDQIELRNGTRGRFAAQVEKVYETDSVKEVDEEGNVVSGNRTKDTAVRTGGGAALGAILGGVIGGGKGAAIGAVIGAGAGAGSVVYQGSKDLQLDPGTEMLIRTAAPARVRD